MFFLCLMRCIRFQCSGFAWYWFACVIHRLVLRGGVPFNQRFFREQQLCSGRVQVGPSQVERRFSSVTTTDTGRMFVNLELICTRFKLQIQRRRNYLQLVGTCFLGLLVRTSRFSGWALCLVTIFMYWSSTLCSITLQQSLWYILS